MHFKEGAAVREACIAAAKAVQNHTPPFFGWVLSDATDDDEVRQDIQPFGQLDRTSESVECANVLLQDASISKVFDRRQGSSRKWDRQLKYAGIFCDEAFGLPFNGLSMHLKNRIHHSRCSGRGSGLDQGDLGELSIYVNLLLRLELPDPCTCFASLSTLCAHKWGSKRPESERIERHGGIGQSENLINRLSSHANQQRGQFRDGVRFSGTSGSNFSAFLQDLVKMSKNSLLGKLGAANFARIQGVLGTTTSPTPPSKVVRSLCMLSENITAGFSSKVAFLLGRIARPAYSQHYPDKQNLYLAEDFFNYTEMEGRRLFDDLDRNKDGEVTLEDLVVAMKKRRLPSHYARELLHQTRSNWLRQSFGWQEFLCLMERKEPKILQAFNSLSLNKFGTLQKGQVLAILHDAGLPATEANASAMMRFLDTDTKGAITYGRFRNFLLLLPSNRLKDDPRRIWFEAAKVVPLDPSADCAVAYG